MPTREQLERLHREDLERLKSFRLMDDDFMNQCFDGNTECVELVLQIILNKPDLRVLEVRTQVFVENILRRSVRLDVLATDSTGALMNIEIQRSDQGAGEKRARYHSSMMDTTNLRKGLHFKDLPETFTIFITENDVLKKGLPLYHIERCIMETGDRFEDGAHIIYVNGSNRDETPLGRLMHDFSCTDPAEMHYDVLADRVKFFKESEEGTLIMCRAMEDMRNQALQQGIEQGAQERAIANARRMITSGKLALKEIAEFSGLSLEQVVSLSKAPDM